MQFSIISQDGEKNITVFIPGHDPLVAHESHPNFEAILNGALNDDESIADLFDVSLTVGGYLEPLTERVSVANGRVYFDGDEVDNSLTKQIVRFLRDGIEDWVPLVNFFEKVQQNPLAHSREQLYNFLRANDFTITPSGDIVAYKGVRLDKTTGIFESIHTGTALVDGVVYHGNIPNTIGSVVTMPRDRVAHDPSQGCSTGLHVATHGYAQGYGENGAVLEVHVNPRDVVSVPHDAANAEKVRVCRYEIVGVKDEPYESPVVIYYDEGDEYDEDYCDCDECLSKYGDGDEYHYEDDGEDDFWSEPLDEGDDPDWTADLSDSFWVDPPAHPSEEEWDALVGEAKRRKKGVVTLAIQRGWNLTDEDNPKVRESWVVSSETTTSKEQEASEFLSWAKTLKYNFVKPKLDRRRTDGND